MTDLVRWWWVRHAPVSATGFCGWSDPEADLSDEQTLAMLRASLPEDAVLLSSDLRRATATADALTRRSWMRAAPTDQLREQNFGRWEGHPYDDDPDLDSFWRDPSGFRPPGGESFADLCLRVGRFVVTESRASESREIVSVAHAGAIRAALALALTLPPAIALSFEIAPLSLTRIDWLAEAKTWRIGTVNYTV